MKNKYKTVVIFTILYFHIFFENKDPLTDLKLKTRKFNLTIFYYNIYVE